jgi:hypothetical protein
MSTDAKRNDAALLHLRQPHSGLPADHEIGFPVFHPASDPSTARAGDG